MPAAWGLSMSRWEQSASAGELPLAETPGNLPVKVLAVFLMNFLITIR